MADYKAPPEELAAYMDSNVPWSEVAEKYGYEDGRAARLDAFTAWKQLREDDQQAQPAPA